MSGDDPITAPANDSDYELTSQPSKKRQKTPLKSINQNRRMAQVSRTQRACDLCRKQKTRCLRSPENPDSCLRCGFLKNECSFSEGSASIEPKDDKLDSIYNGINEILKVLKKGSKEPSNGTIETPSPLTLVDESIELTTLSTGIFQTPNHSFTVSPFELVDKSFSFIPASISNIIHPRLNHRQFDDIITNNILNMDQVTELLNSFNRNYGRWVLFPKTLSTRTLIDRIRSKSSLLLTACCCISLRFALNSSEGNQSINIIKCLQSQLRRDLERSTTSLALTNQIEYLQALVILSLYLYSLSTVFGSVDDEGFVIDPWLISSMGLTAFISKANFGNLYENSAISPLSILYDELDSLEYQNLTNLRIYNHLCLVHLANCIFSGRMCVIDEIRINYCSTTLNLSNSTNFDGRMVSEIEILLITYNYIQMNLNFDSENRLQSIEESFKNVLSEASSWYEQWEFIFLQPNLQFVELCYNFCNLIIYFTYNCQKSMKASVQSQYLFNESKTDELLSSADIESLLKMVDYAHLVIVKIKHIESDSYFAYLSDQMHFMLFFLGVMLSKLIVILERKSHVVDQRSVLIQDMKNLAGKHIAVSQGYKEDLFFNYSQILTKSINSLVE